MSDAAQNRKEQILAASAALFRTKGYAVTTVRDIAQALGIEASSLYSHVKSKEEILETICFTMADKFLQGIEEVNDIYFNATEKLRMAILNHVKLLTNNRDASAVFLHDWRHLSEPRLSNFKQLRDRYENGFYQIMDDGEKEDVFDDVDKKFAVLTILASVNWVNEWYSADGKMSPDEIATHLTQFILTGLRKKMVTDPHYKP
jgi:AcrR family transcriptional regulator